MNFRIRDSIEHWDFSDDINLGVYLDSGLGASKLCPSENREAKVNRCGIDCIESSMQLELSSNTFGLCDRYHMECKLFKDSIIPDRVSLGQNLSVNRLPSESQEKRFVTMSNCNICKFSQTSTAKHLTEQKSQQMIPMSKRPTPCAIVVFDGKSLEESLRKKFDYLRKNIVTRVHICSNFDLDAKVRISKVRQGLELLCCCA